MLAMPFVTFAYNTARQDTTGFTPFFLTFGREAETTLDAMFQEPNEYTAPDLVARLVTQAEESRQLALIRTLEAQEKDRRLYNSRHRAELYQPGDLVWIYIPVPIEAKYPRFREDSYIALPILRDAHKSMQVTLEFRPETNDGLIAYSGEKPDLRGDFISIALNKGFIEFRVQAERDEKEENDYKRKQEGLILELERMKLSMTATSTNTSATAAEKNKYPTPHTQICGKF
ncbi:LAM_G_DOMAIN domain-containing protein [Trichonephila inaurata madagascariensis]|uniref:LAM_G_DOMAIN domain-containing protein n=1 Tax=Trichonephila inaurata madagascariensis TaxID=2747483 RepID=A0A8X7C6L1_9ARAC|nr:LAM_G_DOMAIN domain-containing protein [Trichonephila inaurata madagascariensis]